MNMFRIILASMLALGMMATTLPRSLQDIEATISEDLNKKLNAHVIAIVTVLVRPGQAEQELARASFEVNDMVYGNFIRGFLDPALKAVADQQWMTNGTLSEDVRVYAMAMHEGKLKKIIVHPRN